MTKKTRARRHSAAATNEAQVIPDANVPSLAGLPSGTSSPSGLPTPTTESHCSWVVSRFGHVETCNLGPAYDDEGRCIFHSRDPNKKADILLEAVASMAGEGSIECRGWVFPTAVEITNPSTIDAIDFGDALFLDSFVLASVEIEYANFDFACFNGPARFHHVTFADSVSFSSTMFRDQVYFGFGTSFGRFAFFTDCKFMKWAVFQEVAFDKPITPYRIIFNGGVRFLDCRFPKGMLFEEVGFGLREGPDASDFPGTDLADVIFRKCDLGGVSFLTAYSVNKADFYDVRWRIFPSIPEDLSATGDSDNENDIIYCETLKRGSINDPISATPSLMVFEEREARRWPTASHFNAAARVYRELARSYEEHQNYSEAYAFKDRQLEMRRLAMGVHEHPAVGWVRSNVLSFEAAYRVLSLYGASVKLPLVWLGLLVALAPWAFAWSGIKLPTGTYHLAPVGSTSLDETWRAYTDLLSFSVRAAALLNDLPGTELNLGSQLMELLLRLGSPLLATLAGLAVRRRFGR